MSFLTAAFDRSSSGLSGAVSDTAFSGVSSACGVSSVLLAMSLHSRRWARAELRSSRVADNLKGRRRLRKTSSDFRRTPEPSKFPRPPRFERAQSPGSFGPEPSLEAQIQPSAQRVEPQGSHLRGTATLFRDIFNILN